MKPKEGTKNNSKKITFSDIESGASTSCMDQGAAKKNGGQKRGARSMASSASGGAGKPEWYEELSDQQIQMFKEVFDLLDSDGGGSIDAKELYSCMNNLEINISLEEIQDVLSGLDKDGNGEIDFDEFLYCMAETDKYIDMLTTDGNVEKGYSKRQTLFFTAITKFAIKNSLGDIERYYAAKARQVPHVISHYTAGARLIGLNDKQLEQCLRRMQKAAKNQDSPYAKPLQFVTPSKKKRPVKKTAKTEELESESKTPYTPATESKSIASVASIPTQNIYARSRRAAIGSTSEHTDIMSSLRELAERGSVLAKLPDVHLLPQVRTKLESGPIADVPICSSIRKRRRALEANGHGSHSGGSSGRSTSASASHKSKTHATQRGWHIPQIKRGRVQLPVINISQEDMMKGLTIEDVPEIRNKVTRALDEYYSTLRKAHVKMAWEHWDSLHTEEIPSEKLLKNFKRVYRAYSPHKEGEVFVICPWIPGPRLLSSSRNTSAVTRSPIIPTRPNSSMI